MAVRMVEISRHELEEETRKVLPTLMQRAEAVGRTYFHEMHLQGILRDAGIGCSFVEACQILSGLETEGVVEAVPYPTQAGTGWGYTTN